MSRVWGWTAFAKRSAAMKAPVGLLSGSAVCDSRWRGVAPTSATPTRSHRKCRRIEEVKSRWNTKFSRIENLWPRDGSCPLPLRSKRFINKCFRIVKAQKQVEISAARVDVYKRQLEIWICWATAAPSAICGRSFTVCGRHPIWQCCEWNTTVRPCLLYTSRRV